MSKSFHQPLKCCCFWYESSCLPLCSTVPFGAVTAMSFPVLLTIVEYLSNKIRIFTKNSEFEEWWHFPNTLLPHHRKTVQQLIIYFTLTMASSLDMWDKWDVFCSDLHLQVDCFSQKGHCNWCRWCGWRKCGSPGDAVGVAGSRGLMKEPPSLESCKKTNY